MQFFSSLDVVLIIGSILFTLLTVLFWVLPKFRSDRKPFFVMATTAVSYWVMVDGSLAATSAFSEPLHWTRWAGYAASCGLLMLTMAKLVKIPKEKWPVLLGLNTLVMITGAFASAFSGLTMWMMFILGSLFYLPLMKMIMAGEKAALRPLKKYLMLGWSAFPVVFILSPEGIGVMGVTLAAILYLALDLFTKVLFYFEVFRVKKS